MTVVHDGVRRLLGPVVGAARTTLRRTAREARKMPGVAQAADEAKGAMSSPDELAISDYDARSVREIVALLPELTPSQIARIDGYERAHKQRVTVLRKVAVLQREEPWPGYDELSVPEVRAILEQDDGTLRRRVAAYEPEHRNRAGVLRALPDPSARS